LAIIAAACLMVIPVYQLHEELVDTQQREITHHAQVVASQVSDKLQSLSTNVKHMATLREVRDMLLIGDREEVQEWSVRTRKLFPDSVGLGLVDEQGRYMGDKETLRIGPACASDSREFMQGTLHKKPPIHDENPKLVHFDLLEKILDEDGQVVGMLLMSFHLSMMKDVLSQYVEDGYLYELKIQGGKSIAVAGEGEYPHRVSLPVPGTSWMLEVSADDRLSREDRHLIALNVAWLFLVLLIFLIGVGPYINRQLISDVNKVRALMQYKNMEVNNVNPPVGGIRLQEFSGLLEEIDQLATDITRTRSRLEAQANVDGLTGLMNRRAFETSRERLYQLASGQVLILVLLDIDYFKQINDTYGHAAGDYALKALGRILKKSVRSTDELYRIGGDEVLVVFTSDNLANLQQWYDNLTVSLSEEMQRVEGVDEGATSFTLSGGATRLDPASDSTFSVAMVRADTALYEAKEDGRARLVIT
ncbi:MAG: sensor domain-containing diguanylate cyclase, partial [Gammaproteobacteria bacterium]|nr:sensor domain-containing diguanylate cyclase [Gammaproteobacteria bacterium]